MNSLLSHYQRASGEARPVFNLSYKITKKFLLTLPCPGGH